MPKPLHSLLKSVGIVIPEGFPNPIIDNVTCDSRVASKGSLFLGLQGENFDGGRFWPQALSEGAVAALISEDAAKSNPPSANDPVVILSSSIDKWAGKLASSFWDNPSQSMILIGVTGTNGKTTTSYLIEHLSKFVGRSTALFGTLVNRWPLHSEIASNTTNFADTLQSKLASASLAGAELAVMEVSSHALAQSRVSGCNFAGAIFTNLSQDHLDYHITMEKYFEAKSLLFLPPFLEQGAPRSVVNIDDSWGARLAERLGKNCWRSSLANDAFESSKVELTMTDLQYTSKSIKGILHTPKGSGEFESYLIGSFNLMNLLQAVGVLVQQNFPLKEILNGISEFSGVPGRMERVVIPELEKYSLPTVLIDYAHTPDGLKNALTAARSFSSRNLICLFGCGGDRDRSKRPLMGTIASELADHLVITSDNPRTEDPEEIIFDIIKGIPDKSVMNIEANRAKAIRVAINQAQEGDVILIAGKGHEDYQIIGDERINFNDFEEAKDSLKTRFNNQSQ